MHARQVCTDLRQPSCGLLNGEVARSHWTHSAPGSFWPLRIPRGPGQEKTSSGSLQKYAGSSGDRMWALCRVQSSSLARPHLFPGLPTPSCPPFPAPKAASLSRVRRGPRSFARTPFVPPPPPAWPGGPRSQRQPVNGRLGFCLADQSD